MKTKIFHSANAGLYFWDGDMGLMVDGLYRGRAVGFSDLPPAMEQAAESGTGCFAHLDGLLFNQYRIYADGNHGEIDFTIYAKRSVDEVWYTFDQVKSASFPDRSRYERDVPNGLIGFNQFMFVIDSVQMPSGFTIDELEFAYCPFETTKFCPGVGEYPSTGDGQISVSVCPENYDGYSYRLCEGDRLGDVQLDKRKKFAPTNLPYPERE